MLALQLVAEQDGRLLAALAAVVALAIGFLVTFTLRGGQEGNAVQEGKKGLPGHFKVSHFATSTERLSCRDNMTIDSWW